MKLGKNLDQGQKNIPGTVWCNLKKWLKQDEYITLLQEGINHENKELGQTSTMADDISKQLSNRPGWLCLRESSLKV